MAYKPISHTSEVGFEVSSMDLEKLFVESARALFREMLGSLYGIKIQGEKKIYLEGEDIEDLLHKWLSQLLYEFETSKMVFRQFDVKIEFEDDKFKLHAKLGGEPFDLSKHSIKKALKAVTRHKLHVERERGIWRASVIIDV
ncbi:MAG: archease [Candidatus Caldipriscus sp.]|jgi:SHS2 domain-containing protein|nr:archease [Candidatus Caldipriscus sp.]